jgi:NADH dehydrogenase/NADH:ubiquinone oxidoreductase subunit G
MPNITIDGKTISTEPGATVLQAVRQAGVDLPTLCHLDGLPAYGACRLCLVEMSAPSEGVIASCAHPVEDGMIIHTKSQRATALRKMMLEFMLARCPTSEVILALAKKAGLTGTRFESDYAGRSDAPGSELCILCGLCVRVCSDLVGASAIGFSGRGEHRQVGSPFFLQSESCIGCGACAYVCPTDAIRIEDMDGQRILHTWNTVVPLKPCPVCGASFSPEPMIFLRELAEASSDLWGVCPACRRKQAAAQAMSVLG